VLLCPEESFLVERQLLLGRLLWVVVVVQAETGAEKHSSEEKSANTIFDHVCLKLLFGGEDRQQGR
jgi:hypothetical protein